MSWVSFDLRYGCLFLTHGDLEYNFCNVANLLFLKKSQKIYQIFVVFSLKKHQLYTDCKI